MLGILKVFIIGIFAILGLAAIAACVINKTDEEEEYPMCPILNDHCKYDYSIFVGGNPCKDCDVLKKWEEELNGKL